MSKNKDESKKEEGAVDSFFVDAEEGAFDEISDAYAENNEMSLYEQEPEPEEPEASPEEEDADASTETDETELPPEPEDAVEEEVKEESTVPIHALHEEREKRKVLSRELEDLKSKFRDLFDDYKKLSENPPPMPSGDDGEYVDPRVATLEREVSQLKADRGKLAAENKKTAQQEADQRFKDQVKQANEDLEGEGFPGFEFAVAKVDQRLAEMLKDDPENRIYSNPEGWKKIYKEQIFPSIQSKFTTLDKKQLDEHKKALKKKASLVGGPGKKGAPPKADENKSESELYDDYLSMRMKRGFS